MGYVFTLIACFAMAILYEAIKALKAWLDNKWQLANASDENKNLLTKEEPKLIVPPFDALKDTTRFE